jgi:hypothetical protein
MKGMETNGLFVLGAGAIELVVVDVPKVTRHGRGRDSGGELASSPLLSDPSRPPFHTRRQ